MNLLRAFATVGGLTMISRVMGFIRDILIAAVLGTGAVADAFFVAFRFPNLFRRLFAEGAFNAAFVPLFAKRLESKGRGAARAFAEDALSVLLTALLIVSEPPGQPRRWPEAGLAGLGLEPVEAASGTLNLKVLICPDGAPDAYPRREGVPRRRPLF